MPASRPRAGQRRSLLPAFALIALMVVGGVVLVTVLPGVDLSGRRIPWVALEAYRRAAQESRHLAAGCAVDWTVLAALGKVESDHGRADGPRTLKADGTVTPPIMGPALDGSHGNRAIPDTDKGRLDGDPTWDHAVGPMQIIPTTWRELGRDGNGDGIKDPNNLYDAALTAAAHLCLREPGDYTHPVQLRRALIAYNHSETYAEDVLRWIETYRSMPPEELPETTP